MGDLISVLRLLERPGVIFLAGVEFLERPGVLFLAGVESFFGVEYLFVPSGTEVRRCQLYSVFVLVLRSILHTDRFSIVSDSSVIDSQGVKSPSTPSNNAHS